MYKLDRGPRPLLLDIGRERVATHAELVQAGVPISTVMFRIQPGGRWQRLLPGVVLMHSGRPTTRERMLGALAYAGPNAVLSGMAALSLHGLRTAKPGAVQVLVPHERRKQNHGYAVVERTRKFPAPQSIRELNGLPSASLARAVVDAARRLEEVNAVRNLVADAVQNHRLPLGELAQSVREAARQRTAISRLVMAEIEAGVRFAAEAQARVIIRGCGLPEPLYNVELLVDGRIIAIPDGYFDEWACGYQIDSRRWHASPEDYELTTAKRGYAGRFGVLLLAVTPNRIFEDPDGFLEDLSGMITIARQRPAPMIAYRRRSAG
jgi:predicted transcriptional regulator of viral defense system